MPELQLGPFEPPILPRQLARGQGCLVDIAQMRMQHSAQLGQMHVLALAVKEGASEFLVMKKVPIVGGAALGRGFRG